MNPKLVGSAGEFPLSGDGITIGRDSTNTIPLEDKMVSSCHCRVESDNGRFVLVDNDSRNGTYVNGQAITRTYLEDGDEIRVGRTTFRFLVDGSGSQPGRRVRLEDPDESAVLSSETVELDPNDSVYLKTDFGADALQLRRLAHDMSVLLKLSAEISEIADSETLQNLLLERIFDVVPAENGAILIASEGNQLFLSSPVSRQRMPGSGQIGVSHTVTQSVLRSGQSILRNDLLSDGASPDSIVASRLHSLLCVPLSVMGTRIGVIYLNTTAQDTRFDKRHLELATAIAAIAAVALEHLRYVEWLESENEQLSNEIALRHDMIGQSPKMKAVYEKIGQLAQAESRVLILGETGTGKELAAHAIHKNSSRANGRFVAVNCGGINETLFMSELFGHVKGAFTGADRNKPGFIEIANDGTLFLDEVGDLPPHCQSALLRVIEDSQVIPVGSTDPRRVNVRLLSATSRPLKDEVSGGRFRADLYFRLGLPLEMPSLRDRLEDIPLLVRFFVQQHKQLNNRELGPTPPETIRVLQEYAWPGNVRELGLAIQWAVVFGKSNHIRPEDLPPEIVNRATAARQQQGIRKLDDAKDSYERQLIVRALEETRGVVSEAAALVDRVPTYLQRRITQLGLRDELKRIREGR